MSPRAKKEYLKAIASRYKQTSRPEKRTILDKFCAVTGDNRKHSITHMAIL